MLKNERMDDCSKVSPEKRVLAVAPLFPNTIIVFSLLFLFVLYCMERV